MDYFIFIYKNRYYTNLVYFGPINGADDGTAFLTVIYITSAFFGIKKQFICYIKSSLKKLK